MRQDSSINGNTSFLPSHSTGKEKMVSRSEIAQEIISRKSDFVEHWALVFFLLILIILLLSTWYIKYPDVVEAKAILSADNGPKEIIPLQEGRLIKLFVHNDDQIKAGGMIGWIESTADHKEVIQLSQQLDSTIQYLKEEQFKKIAFLFNQHYAHLGELQTVYQQYIVSWQQFNDYLINGFYQRKKIALQQDITTLYRMNGSNSKQKRIAEQDIALADSSFRMNDVLLNENVISKKEHRNEKSKFLNKQSALPQLNASQLLSETQQREKQKEIDQLDYDINQEKLTFEQTLNSLKNTVDDWIGKYTLRSPIGGKIVFTTPLQQNKFLQQGKLLGYVLPDSAHYYAEVILPQSNFGKVAVGQQVQLRLDAYPYAEFGFVGGKVDYISEVPSDSGFLAIVNINKNMTTSYHNNLQFKNGLQAQAIIITHNMRLLKRMYYLIINGVSVGKRN